VAQGAQQSKHKNVLGEKRRRKPSDRGKLTCEAEKIKQATRGGTRAGERNTEGDRMAIQ